MATTATSSVVEELRQILATPKPGAAASANPNMIAHAALQALRDEGDCRFLFLRSILEISGIIAQQPQFQQQQMMAQQNEELLFHCITGMRHILLTKWKIFCGAFRKLVRDYFMALGNCSNMNDKNDAPIFSRTIRLALYNASTSFWKRQWNDESNNASDSNTVVTPAEQNLMESIVAQQQHNLVQSSLRLQVPELNTQEDLFRYLDAAMTTPGIEMSSAAGFLDILVGEFAGKSASQYNMPLEFHKRAHSTFEQNGWLDQALQISMKALSQVVALLNNSSIIEKFKEDLALVVVQLTIDVIGWEFGTSAWDSGGFPTVKASPLVRPPVAWRSVLVQPEFVKAIFLMHSRVAHSNGQRLSSELGHSIRQLILLLASLFGPIFPTPEDQTTFASFLLEGILHLLNTSGKSVTDTNEESSELLDTLSMVSRLIVNYKLTILVQLPLLQSLLHAMGNMGRYLLQENLRECQSVQGDIESMEHREWREEALTLLVEGIVLLCNDPWLLYSGSEDSRKGAQAALATSLGPLYREFVTCRTQMAKLEETYLMANETDLDEVREEIYAVDLEEEMTSLAAVGRLDLKASLSCLSTSFNEMVPQLQALWNSPTSNAVSPEAAGVLEQSRLVTLYIGHLLTDENAGETRVIPDTILSVCQNDQAISDVILSAVQLIQQFAEFQVSKIIANPSDQRLSPLLAKTFLWFFNRWAPAYILPETYGASTEPSTIALAWKNPEKVQQSLSFIIILCLQYNCYWSQEGQVQDNAALMLLSLAKRGSNMRLAIVSCPQFRQLVIYFCLTCGIRHSAPQEEFETIVRNKAGNNFQNMSLDINMLRGFHRLPYETKRKLLTGILISCGEKDDEASSAFLKDCFTATHDAFSSLVNVLSTKQMKPDNMDAKEMSCLCISLYDGIALAGEMKGAERIPEFISPSLAHLSGLMEFYSQDLTICEGLLRFFRDYSSHFISVLNGPQCLLLFQASSNLLKSYSSNHCSSNRLITNSAVGGDCTLEEEEQKYSDVLCAIELLVQLGSKDFFYTDEQSVDSKQVSEMIFVGLQQILPLMNRGLLQYPSLCSQFLQLVGFMLESYADELKMLPFDLFDALLESLLYGMTYHDASIAKSSLQGISGIAKAHLSNRVLDVHIAATPPNSEGLIDKCTRRLLTEVIFQNVIWDRLEPAGMALLPLAAIDINSFGRVVQAIAQQIPPEQQQRLMSNFESLIRADVVSKMATSKGHEGRKNRILFKKDFESFCHEIHSFLLKK